MAATKARKSAKKSTKKYKKKPISDEEKAKRKEEQEKKVSAAKEALVKAISGLDSKEEWINFLDHVAKRSKFAPSRLSFINQMLVYMQDENATAVATYQRWRKIKRWPAKGSKGIMIFRPIPITIPIEKATPEDIANGNIFTDKSGKKKIKTGRIYFAPMYVFDIAVTEGEELPPDWLAPPELPDFEDKEVFSSSVEKLAILLENATDGKVKGVQIIERSKLPKEEQHPRAAGWYNKKSKKIVIVRDKNRSKMFATLVHEAAHALLHGDDENTTTSQKEIEAESVAYVVTKALGLDTGVAAIVYVASWSKGKKEVAIKQIEESAKRIVKASNTILDLLMPIDDDDDGIMSAEEPFIASESMCNCSNTRKIREPKPNSKINPKELAIGTKHELEHVNLKPGKKPTKKQIEFAEKIAIDHLKEHPKYYTKLEKCNLDEPKPACKTTPKPLVELKKTAKSMGGKVSGSDITLPNTIKAREFESLLKEDEYTYTKNRKGKGYVFTVGCDEASLTLASLGEPKRKVTKRKTTKKRIIKRKTTKR